MKSQLRLPLKHRVVYRREDFVVSSVNAGAVARLSAPQTWPGGVMALIGPEGSGKTHLASVWAAENSAVGPEDAQPGPVLIENADQWKNAEGLFHLLNRAGEAGSSLLLTARTPPIDWPSPLPDLRSRLNAIEIAELGEPDDTVLEGLIRKLFMERHIVPADDLIPYLLPRVERSGSAARALVAALDEKSAAERREVNRALAQDMFKVDTVTDDVLEPGGET